MTPQTQSPATAPHTVTVGDPRVRASNVAEPIWNVWREQLAAVGGPSPLLHFVDSPRTRIELSTTHPGGLAKFITGKTTLLSSLIRDDIALRSARVAADRIAAKGVELSSARGIDAIHLGIGIIEWTHGDESYRAPILLRSLAMRRHGSDFELKLRREAFLNPDLARAFATQFGIVLDPFAFVALTDDNGTFKPNAVIDRLRGLTSHLSGINIQPRLVVSSFADVATPLVEDSHDLSHPLLNAIAGNASARWSVEKSFAPVEPAHPDHREPTTDTLLLDADAEQEYVVAQIAAGNSIVVKTLPGTGGTQTIVNAIGALVGQSKRVLVCSPRRGSLRDIAQRLTDIGLGGLAATPRTVRRDVLRSISRAEKAKQPQLGDVNEALVRLRNVLLNYRGALSKPDPVLQVSVLDCVTELSRLALLPQPPSTTARLSRTSVELLAADRDRAAEVMVQAARLGEFKYGPGDSPWYGADFASGEDAQRAHSLARRLHTDSLPRLLARARDLVATTPLRPFRTVNELGIYLRLLTDLRDTLDRFVPAVFDRSVSELVAATAPRKEAPEMSAVNRRRLRKLAAEYVRPGVNVGDLHAALTRIQQQRVLWQRFAKPGAVPEVPIGIADVAVLYQQVSQDLGVLDGPLGFSGRESQLAARPIDALTTIVADLAADSDVLLNLQERAKLMATLRGLQLDPLISDLALRHVPEDQVAAELEQSWWKSALESLLQADRALLGADTTVLDRLEADFRLVDEAHAGAGAAMLAWQLAEAWSIGLIDWPEEADELRNLLRRESCSVRELHESAPHLSRAIAPVWLASPYEIDQITDRMPFDTVLLVDAGATLLAESVGAIRRGKQIVAFGDPVTQTPMPFSVAVPDDHEPPAVADVDALHDESTLARLGSLLPTLSLTRSYRAGGEDLAELVNRRFYGGRIESLPWAGSFLGHPSIAVHVVDGGHGMPDEESGAVESVDAEVQRAVELVVEHARSRPHESLMVVTASIKHAVRVQQAVLAAASTRTEVTNFVVRDSPEPFTVLTLDQAVAQSRDRVIFSIGFGRTPHGRLLSNLGPLGQPGGERLLAVAMTRARRSMAIVSCFEAGDIDESRMQHGAIALAEILGEVAAREASVPIPDDSDPMLVDLSRRLESRGLRVALGHRGKLGLVASLGGRCIAIESDAVLHRASLRESLRLRPEMLRRLGWHYLRVHAFELFSNPDAVADRVVEILGGGAAPVTGRLAIGAGTPSD